jgi:hypothetical protein
MSIQEISLSGRKKVVSNKEMTFFERMYLIAIFKGLWITIKHFFRKKATIQYPDQVREMSPVYRGQHMLKRDEQGRESKAVNVLPNASPSSPCLILLVETQYLVAFLGRYKRVRGVRRGDHHGEHRSQPVL